MQYLMTYRNWKRIFESNAEFSQNLETIKYGDRGDSVKTIQAALVNLNYSLPAYGVDGKFGPETKAAVEQFQKENNLEVTGVVDLDMINLLTSGLAKKISPEDTGKFVKGFSAITKEITDYDTIVATVIDKLEGGYYHPNMALTNPAKFGAYSKSGETMFGLDRHAGHNLYYSSPRKEKSVRENLPHIESGEYQYRTAEAKEFWETIDAADAKEKWEWNYKGGELENRLRYLAGRIIKPQFDMLVNRFLSPEAKQIVSKDGRLLFHFIYATWNGPGWFKKFATDINDAVKNGIVNPDALIQVAMDSRTKEGLSPNSSPNSLIAQGGEKIKSIVGTA
jgi:hypothetical protein